MPHRLTPLVSLLALFAAACGSGNSAGPSSSTTSGTGGSPGTTSSTGGSAGGQNPADYLSPDKSCAYACPVDQCPEATAGYSCPALNEWSKIPHLAACEKWDGKYPAIAAGTCTATAPTAEALKRTGADPDDPAARILPDGRTTKPAGKEWEFDEADQSGGTTSAILAIPGTSYVVTVDTGNDDHAVRVVDTSKIGSGNPVTGYVKLSSLTLNSGVAYVAPGRVYVAAQGVVQAFTVDAATGALARDDASSLALAPFNGKPWYAASVAASPDGKLLVVTPVDDTHALVFDVDPASPTYKSQVGSADLGESETFGVFFDPADSKGTRAYVTMWGGHKVVELDLSTPSAPAMSRTFAVDKNPQGLAFLDARWMAVANDFGETVSLVDRTSGTVTSVPVDFEPGLKGLDVSGLTWDPVGKRLYVTLSGINAIAAYDVDLGTSPPTLKPAGRLPTSWWPSGIVAHADGALTVVNLRGHPIGPYPKPEPIDGGQGDNQMKGSVAHVPAPSAADLTAGTAKVAASVAVGAKAGYPSVTCPGATKDFPVPATNTEGPSPAIKHVFFIVRENKTFDGVFGDMPGVEGDKSLTMKATTDDMDRVWPNIRALAKTWAHSDNFYSLAVKSTQGHHWTTYGRATDFCERTWSAGPRALPLCGITDEGRPEEGSLFEWLGKNQVAYDLLGEIVGSPQTIPAGASPIDASYPGGPYQNITYPDVEKACYTAARVRVACDIKSFVYMTLPNDHSVGVSKDSPTPETMVAVNDEATGMFLDGLSHSPLWASSLVIITEDDPQSGGDHVDYHRTPLVLVSPWVKKGYVSKTHIDVASIHKIFAHVLGLPYPNLVVKNAGIPFDAFTSTPDYAPFTYLPRKEPIACATAVTGAEQQLTGSWDFEDVDEQPGLGEQVFRWMRGKQLDKLPPRLQRQVDQRIERKALGLPAVRDLDD